MMAKEKTIEITLTEVECETLIQCLRHHNIIQVRGALEENGYRNVDIYGTTTQIEEKLIEAW